MADGWMVDVSMRMELKMNEWNDVDVDVEY